MKTLDMGSAGPDVAVCQTILTAMWMTDANGKFLELDGQFGIKTRQAVLEFQRKAKNNGMYDGRIDGIFGPKCWAAVGVGAYGG